MERKRKGDLLSNDECNSRKKEAVLCTVCIEDLTDDNRSLVKLQCGHQFHLDCIGSAFNAKRAMHCPNCRRYEKGNWRFANGSQLTSSVMVEINTRLQEIIALQEDRIVILERLLEEHKKQYELFKKLMDEFIEKIGQFVADPDQSGPEGNTGSGNGINGSND